LSDYRVLVTLTEEEANGVQTILDQLIDIDLFKEIPYDSYTALEKFIKATNMELENRKRQNSRSGFEWGEICQLCNHSSKDHVKESGLCCKESCSNCFQFVPSGKPF
jgi:hypothetical protein